jgi:hypothetical protein
LKDHGVRLASVAIFKAVLMKSLELLLNEIETISNAGHIVLIKFDGERAKEKISCVLSILSDGQYQVIQRHGEDLRMVLSKVIDDFFMAMPISQNDKIKIQPYLSLMSKYVDSEIEASEFEKKFLEMRRNDECWMSGLLDYRLGKILDTFFLDVDSYAPPELLDRNNGDIDATELRSCASKAIEILKMLISGD